MSISNFLTTVFLMDILSVCGRSTYLFRFKLHCNVSLPTGHSQPRTLRTVIVDPDHQHGPPYSLTLVHPVDDIIAKAMKPTNIRISSRHSPSVWVPRGRSRISINSLSETAISVQQDEIQDIPTYEYIASIVRVFQLDMARACEIPQGARCEGTKEDA